MKRRLIVFNKGDGNEQGGGRRGGIHDGRSARAFGCRAAGEHVHQLDRAPGDCLSIAPVTDPIAALNRDLRADPLRLKFEGPSGYLRSTLDALRVPIESQIALFGQDSLQRERISTLNPRAIFFNDTVSVAWVRGGFIEVASQDPQQGVVFYVLDNVREDKPQFTRREDCLSCHYSFSTVGVPGMLDQNSAG